MFSPMPDHFNIKVERCLRFFRTSLFAATAVVAAQFAGQSQAAGFVVNNGVPQTGVVVGRGSGSPDIVSASGTFAGSYSQNLANGYATELAAINTNTVITLPGPGSVSNAWVQNSGITYTNYYNGLIEIKQGGFTNFGTINATFSSLPASTGPVQGLDPFISGMPPSNYQPTNNYYYGIGLLAWDGNLGYSTRSTIYNSRGATIKSIVTGSGVSYAMGIDSLQYYGDASKPNITINNFGIVDAEITNHDGTASGILHYSLYGGLNLTNGAGGVCSGAAPYYGSGITAYSYYGPVNLENDGTATGLATGATSGWVAGNADSVGIDIYTYDNSSNAPISAVNTGTASGLNTGSILTNGCHGIFLWAEGGPMTLNNTGMISANSTTNTATNTVAWAKPVYCGGNRGPDLVINSGTITGTAGNGGGWGLGVENDTAVPNDAFNTITILNSGTIYHNNGLGVAVFAGTGPAIISNSVSGSIYGGNEGIAAENYPGTVTIYNYGSIQAGSANNNAVDLGSGNDTVHLYGLPNIVGWMNGQGGSNVLDFQLTGVLQQVNGNAAMLGNTLAAYNLGTSGSIVVSGQTYKWANFNVTGTITSTGGVGPVVKAATNTDLTAGVSWTGGIPPIAGNIAGWTNTSLGAGLTMNSAISWGGVSVAGAASDIAISGSGPLTLGANGLDLSVSPVNLLMSVPVILGTNQTWNVNGGRSLSAAGVISGNYGLTKAGAGVLALTNANTFAGGTTVNGGTLALDYNPNDGATGTLAGGSTVTINSGGTLRLDVEDGLGYYGGNPSQLNINGGLVTSANVANTTPVQWGGTSFRVTLPTVNFTGGTLSSGTNNQGDQYGGSYLIQSAVNTLASSSTALINAHSVSLQNTTFTVAAGSTPSGVDLSVASILNNWVSGPQSLTKAGNGVMVLSNASTYSGTTTISAGTLALAGNGSIANTPNIVIAGGATFDVSALNSPFVLGSSQTLSNRTSTAVFKGNASTAAGTVSLTYAGGTPALAMTNGTLTLSSGTVFKISNTGSQLAVGSYKLIAKAGGGAVGGTVTTNLVPVGGGGAAAPAKLNLANGELNLVVGNPVNTTPANLTVKFSGNTLNLAWPADHLGWTLQTNSVGLAATNKWFPYAGSASVTNVTINISSSTSNVFYRMTYP